MRRGAVAVCAVGLALACQPRVAIEAPKDPIVINMNVKIEHEIRVRVDKELDDLLDDEDLFGEVEE